MASYLTGQFDNARTGWNPNETVLTVASVMAGFGRLFHHDLDGTVYAQPLYVQDLSVPGKGRRNVVVVATEANTVYLIDADTNQPALQSRSLIPNGERAVLWSDVGDPRTPRYHTFGVTGTPVIDAQARTIYIVAKTREVARPRFHHRLHALDLVSLADKPGSPVDITASSSTGLNFESRLQLQRPALLLAGGGIYVAFGSHGDSIPTQGWILSYDAGTLAQRAAFSTTIHPNGLANVWQSGCGLSADVDGFIYCATGNGDFTAPGGGHDYANSVLKLTKDLRLADYFCPCNQCHLNASDADLGSGGVLILPDQPGSIRRLLLAGGKEGSIYLLNRSNLGKFNDPHDPHCKGDTTAQYCADAIVQRLWRAVGGGPTNTHARDAIFGGAAYYAGPTGMFVYYAGQDDNLRAFSLLGGRLSPASVMQSSDVYSRPSGDNGGGSTPVVSSDGAKLGTGIVWTIVRAAEGRELVLRAHDAADLTNKLTERNSGTWWIPGTPFLVPTVVNGKVYVATTGMLVVFGLLNLALAFKFRTTRIPRGQSAIGSLVLSGDAEDGVDILLTATDSNGNDVQIDTDRVTLSSARPTTAIAVATQGLPPKTLVDVQASALDGTVFADVILRVV